VRQRKPVEKMSCHSKCLKYGKDYVFYVEFGFKKALREGCFSCHSKKMEHKSDEWEETNIHFTTDECPKCHRTKIVDILNWEEFKGDIIKKHGWADKKACIQGMNKKLEMTCYCSSQSLITNRSSPWVIAGSIVGGVLLIGLVIYLVNYWFDSRKRKE
jgi:hypothetical protein